VSNFSLVLTSQTYHSAVQIGSRAWRQGTNQTINQSINQSLSQSVSQSWIFEVS